MKKLKKINNRINTEWNLKLLYKNHNDIKIEKDIENTEKMINDFVIKYDTENKNYQKDENALLEILSDYEKLSENTENNAITYFSLSQDLNANDRIATSKLALLSNRMAKLGNKMTFFEISIGKIEKDLQDKFLKSEKLKHFRVFLKRIFDDAKYSLSIPEEKIMNLKSQPAYEMWVSGNEKILNMKTVKFKGETMPISKAMSTMRYISKSKERSKLALEINKVLKEVSSFSEAEINAVITNKKINDELRGYKTPYENRVVSCENDPRVVDDLVRIVTDSFNISHRFYKIKAKLLKQKRLNYEDRSVNIGKIKTSFDFKDSLSIFKKTLDNIDPKFTKILDNYIKNGQIDVYPKVGKTGGAYCAGSYKVPTFVLLNHVDGLNSFSTLAHEMGHAFHTELSKTQGILYHGYSTSLAETASTLFEALAFESIFEKLSPKEQIILLHDRISDDISTVFRQIACFNFELELHNTIRQKGFLSKEEIANIHNKNMKSYLGPLFDFKEDDGYFFVVWSHIRNFFYVYTYAYGQLVSKALFAKYKRDKNFWKSIETFLSAGGKASPEEILKEIGLDVYNGDIWREGLVQIEKDIEKLEKLAKI